jgi:hypothetical protein
LKPLVGSTTTGEQHLIKLLKKRKEQKISKLPVERAVMGTSLKNSKKNQNYNEVQIWSGRTKNEFSMPPIGWLGIFIFNAIFEIVAPFRIFFVF